MQKNYPPEKKIPKLSQTGSSVERRGRGGEEAPGGKGGRATHCPRRALPLPEAQGAWWMFTPRPWVGTAVLSTAADGQVSIHSECLSMDSPLGDQHPVSCSPLRAPPLA